MLRTEGEELFLQCQIDKALPILKEEGKQGNGRSMYLLGTIYREGYGHVTADEDIATSWFQKGKELGNSLCGVSLIGSASGNNLWDLVNIFFAKALREAAAGDVLAMDEVGRFYTEGGVMYKPEEGLKWITKSALFEYWRGLYDMGRMYQEGVIAAQSDEKAMACYKKAAAFGDAYSAYQLGLYGLDHSQTVHEVETSVKWLESSFAHGNGDAALVLGTFYENGGDGLIEMKPDTAITWFEKGLSVGQAECASELAFYYREGIVVPKDKEKALALYKKAVTLGDEDSLFSLALLYMENKEEEKALPYLLKAAETGNRKAQYMAGYMYIFGKGTEENREEGIFYLEQAAQGGDQGAEKLLAELGVSAL